MAREVNLGAPDAEAFLHLVHAPSAHGAEVEDLVASRSELDLADDDLRDQLLAYFLRSFTSEEFYNPEVRGAKIKSPTEMLIGVLKVFGVDTIKPDDWAYIYDTGRSLQQQLLEPPNVAGWPGQREWISSNTYPQRGGYSDAIVNGRTVSGRNLLNKIKPIDYVKTFNSKTNPQLSEDAVKLVDELSSIFLPYPLSDKRKKFLLDTLLDGTTIANWSTGTPMADVRIQKFLRAMMRLPEFQLT